MATNNTKQATWLALGSLFSFAIGIISPMILARYFNKSDYGTYKQVMYVYNTFLTLFTLGIPRAYAYFIPKVPIEQAKNVIDKITRIFFVLGIMFSAFLFVCATPIANFLNNPSLSEALMWFSPVPLFMLPTMGLEGIYASFQRTHQIALYTITTRIVTVLLTITPVILFNSSYIYAIIGFDIAALLTCVIALYMKSIPAKCDKYVKTIITYGQIFRFSLPLLYASIWGMIIYSANQFFISRYYGNEIFADFSNGFIELPFIGMILGSVGAVLLPIFSKMNNEATFVDAITLWRNTLIKSAQIIFPMSIFSIFAAELLMVCMYGDNYASSGVYFIIKNTGSLMYVIPFAPVMIALGKVTEYAKCHLYSAIAIVIIDIFCVKILNNVVMIAISFTICETFRMIYMMHIIAKTLATSISQMLPKRKLITLLIVSTSAGVCMSCVISILQTNKFITLFIGFSIYIILYYILCFVFKLSYRDIVHSYLPKFEQSKFLKLIP